MSHTMAVDMERLGLSNVGGPELDEQITEALRDIAASFEREATEGGNRNLKADLKVVVTFTMDAESGAVKVSSKATRTLPSRRSVSTFALMRGGSFYIDNAHRRQVPMFGDPSDVGTSNVAQLRGKE